MSNRKSNLELMRIILMCAIPAYHLMLYNGVIYVPYHSNTIIGLICSCGFAIAGNYAFLALSVYYLLEAKDKPVIKKFLSVGMQVFLLYLVKVITLRSMFGFHNQKFFVDLFLMHGAWWYIYAYLILMLLYPLLNYILDYAKESLLLIFTIILGVAVAFNGVTNIYYLGNDVVVFTFVYLFMGMMKRNQYQNILGIPNKKRFLVPIIFLIYGVMLAICIYVKHPISGMENETANEIVRHLIGRYNIFTCFMGIFIFFTFFSLNIKSSHLINTLAKATFYVFLLHDTIMGIFWKLGYLTPAISNLSRHTFVAWIGIYIVCCFIIGLIFHMVYQWLNRLFFSKWINYICSLRLLKFLEKQYYRMNDRGKER